MALLPPRYYDQELDFRPVVTRTGFQLAVTLLLAVPLVLLFWLDELPFYKLAVTALAAAVLLFGGWPFFTGALRQWRRPGRLVLIALALAALLTALLLSLEPEIRGGTLPWSAAATAVVLLAAGWGEEKWLAKTFLLKNRTGGETGQECTQADQTPKISGPDLSSSLIYITLVVALATAAWWGVVSDPLMALERFSAVLLVASPAAAALAVGWPGRRELGYLRERFGLRLDRAAVLEQWRRIGVLIADQDSLFQTAWRLVEIRRLSQNYSERTLRHWAASVMVHSAGPVASTLARSGRPRRISRYRTIPDQGAEAVVEGRLVRVATLDHGRSLTGGERLEALEFEAARYRVIAVDERVEALFLLKRAPRRGIKPAVQALLNQGVRTVLLVRGSEPDPAGSARQLGFAEYLTSPVSRSVLTARLGGSSAGSASGHPGRSDIAILGDRETPESLAAVSQIRLSFRNEAAAAAADILIEAEDLPDLSALSAAAERLDRSVRQGLAAAAGYHLIACLLATGALMGWGITLPPPAAALVGFLPVWGFLLTARFVSFGAGR